MPYSPANFISSSEHDDGRRLLGNCSALRRVSTVRVRPISIRIAALSGVVNTGGLVADPSAFRRPLYPRADDGSCFGKQTGAAVFIVNIRRRPRKILLAFWCCLSRELPLHANCTTVVEVGRCRFQSTVVTVQHILRVACVCVCVCV